MAGFATIDTRAGWGVGLILFVVGTALTGGVIDRYARQRPLDARAFWGVSGELTFRLLRLNLLTAGALAIWLRLLFVPVVLLVPGEDARLAAYQASLVVFAAVQLVVGECARVRIVVERRRSVLFAIVAGIRFLTRHLGQVALLAAGARPHVRARRPHRGPVAGRPARRVRGGVRRARGGARELRGVDVPLPGLARACRLRGAAPPGLAGFAGHRDPRRAA